MSDDERLLNELAREYETRCEVYDRTVCTGPIGRDGIMPANGRELARVSNHADAVARELAERAGVHLSTLHAYIRVFPQPRG